MKECATCHETKPITDFYTYTKKHCRLCDKQLQKTARDKRKVELEKQRVICLNVESSDESTNIPSDKLDTRSITMSTHDQDLTIATLHGLETIVKQQGQLIEDLQRRIVVLEDILLERSVTNLTL